MINLLKTLTRHLIESPPRFIPRWKYRTAVESFLSVAIEEFFHLGCKGRPLGTVAELLERVRRGVLLVLVMPTRRMGERPRLHAAPVLAQPDLMRRRRFVRLAHARVPRDVVGGAEDLLAQGVKGSGRRGTRAPSAPRPVGTLGLPFGFSSARAR